MSKKTTKPKNGENLDKLYNQYFKWQQDFQEKYGEKTVVLCQVGAFFEIYGVNNDFEKVGVAKEIAKLLNIQCTLKNKKKGPGNNRKNPEMAGFQPPYLQRHLELLLSHDWTAVLIEQVTPPPNPKRAITNIVSPGTYVDFNSKPDNNYIASLMIDVGKCYKTQMDILMIGLAAMDVSTGESVIHYFNDQENSLNHISSSMKEDYSRVQEEIFRFMEIYNPKEIIINSQNLSLESRENLLSNINFNNRLVYTDTLKKESSEIFKIDYQNQFLEKLYPETGYLEPIEYIDLEESPIGSLNFVILLKFIYEHSPKIIERI